MTGRIFFHTPTGGTSVVAAGYTPIQWQFGNFVGEWINLASKSIQFVILKVLVADSDLDGFRVIGRLMNDEADSEIILASSAEDFSEQAGPFIQSARVFDNTDAFLNNDPTTIADSYYAVLVINVAGLARLKIEASSAATSAVTAFLTGLPAEYPSGLGGTQRGPSSDLLTCSPQAQLATGAGWTDILIPAGARTALVSVGTNNVFLVPQHVPSVADPTGAGGGADPAQNGVSYKVNSVYPLPLYGYNDGASFLCYKQDGGAGTIEISFWTS